MLTISVSRSAVHPQAELLSLQWSSPIPRPQDSSTLTFTLPKVKGLDHMEYPSSSSCLRTRSLTAVRRFADEFCTRLSIDKEVLR